jgi:hypothetical protein
MSPARHPGSERYRLELEALADDVPAAVRLRRALKCLLRAFGLRCRSVPDLAPRQLRDGDGDGAPPAGPAGRSDAP